jgi:valyl-tRNA synthetase
VTFSVPPQTGDNAGLSIRSGSPMTRTVTCVKLQKEADKLRGQIGGIEKKLGNEGFVAKAPPAVIEKERQSLAALQAQLAGIEQSLRELG